MSKVLELIQELATFEKEPDAVAIDLAELEDNLVADPPTFKCFVALIEGKIQGCAICYTRFSTWKGKTVHLEDLIVTRTYRGRGLGKALYNKVLSYARNLNVRRVEWVVLDWNKNAIEFYEKSGAVMIKNWYLAQMDQASLNNYLTDEGI